MLPGLAIRVSRIALPWAVRTLQVFNSRTCQLVLGAGALAAAGLRSITAKHLAMAAQCVGAVMGLHPALTAILTGPLPHTRRAILLPDFERLLQVRLL